MLSSVPNTTAPRAILGGGLSAFMSSTTDSSPSNNEAEATRRRIPPHLLQRKNLGEILFLCAQHYMDTIPDDDPRGEYLQSIWNSHSLDASPKADPDHRSSATVVRVVREIQRVERVLAVSILPRVISIFGSLERKEGFREFVALCSKAGGREFVEEVLNYDDMKRHSPQSSASNGPTGANKPASKKADRNLDSKFFRKAPPVFPPELNVLRLLQVLTQASGTRTSGKHRSSHDNLPPPLTPAQLDETLSSDEFTRNPRLSWPLQVLTLCTSFYLSCLHYGFDIMAGLFVKSAVNNSGKGFLAALAVSTACSELDIVVTELNATTTDLLASDDPASPPYLEENKQAIQLRVCNALVRSTAKFARMAALVGTCYERHLDRGLGRDLYGLVPVLRKAQHANREAFPPLAIPSTLESAGSTSAYCNTICTHATGCVGPRSDSNLSFGSGGDVLSDDESPFPGSSGGSSMFSESPTSTESEEVSPSQSLTSYSGSIQLPRQRFFGTNEFTGLGIADSLPPPLNPMVSGSIVSILVINTPIFVLRIIVDECNQAHQWRGRNPFVPPPLPHPSRISSAKRERYIGPVGDVVPKAPVTIARIFTSRTAEVCGHPADIVRLEALLAALSGLHSGYKIHRDALPKACPENSPHFNASLPLQLLSAFRDSGLSIKKTDLAVAVNCPAKGASSADPNALLYDIAHAVSVWPHDIRRGRLVMESEYDKVIPTSDYTYGFSMFTIMVDFSPARISIGKIISWEAGGSIGLVSMPDDVYHAPTSLLPPLKRSGREDILRKTLRHLAIFNTVVKSVVWYPTDEPNRVTHATSLKTTFAEMGLLVPADSVNIPNDVVSACRPAVTPPISPMSRDDDLLASTYSGGGTMHKRSMNSNSISSTHIGGPPPHPTGPPRQSARVRSLSLIVGADGGGGGGPPPFRGSIHNPLLSHPAPAPTTTATPDTEHTPTNEATDLPHLTLAEQTMLPFSTPWQADTLHSSNANLVLGGVARYPPMQTSGCGQAPPLGDADILLSRPYSMPKYIDYRAGEGGPSAVTSPSSLVSNRVANRPYDMSDTVRISEPSADIDILECARKHFLSLAAVEVARRLSLVTELDFPPHCLLLCWNVHGLLELWDAILFRSKLVDSGTLLQ